jgi:hypothetical protein
MTTITFDTHKFVRKLQEAGFDEKQAEELTEAMRTAIDESELVTKKDFDLYDSIVNADVPGSEGDSIATRPASTK